MTRRPPETYADLALRLSTVDDAEVAERVVIEARSLLGLAGATVALHRGRRLEVVARAGDVATLVDPGGAVTDGPMLEVSRDKPTLELDLWMYGGEPSVTGATWQERLLAAGVGSVLCLRLAAARELGVLALYGAEPGCLTRDDVSDARVLAGHATAALVGAGERAGLQRAIDARHVIGQAQGILMERLGVEPAQAFELLQRRSQHANLRLRVVAEEIVAGRGAGRAATGTPPGN